MQVLRKYTLRGESLEVRVFSSPSGEVYFHELTFEVNLQTEEVFNVFVPITASYRFLTKELDRVPVIVKYFNKFKNL